MKVTGYFLKLIPTPVSKALYAKIILPLTYLPKKKKMMKMYSKFIAPGDLVFDIGANEGHVTNVLISLGARVIAVEPIPDCVKNLERKFKNKDVTVIAKGVADKEGELTLHICEKRNMISTFSEEWTSGRYSSSDTWNKKVQVPVTTLSNLIKEFGTPKFCKIDVEGFEKKVISGLDTKVPALSFEFHKEFIEDTKKCINHLKSLGNVKLNIDLGEKQELELKEPVTAEELLNKLESSENQDLNGNIYVTLE